MAVQNYHLTLAFLGDITASQLLIVEEQLDKLSQTEFSLQLDEVGYWPDSQVLWLGPSTVPDGMTILANRCKRAANSASIKVDKRVYRPHLTLARKARLPPAAPLLDPDFQMSVHTFQLYESLLDRRGVRYREIRDWVLDS